MQLDAFHKTDSEVVSNIVASDALRSAEPVLSIVGSIHSDEGIENEGSHFIDLASAEDEVQRSIEESAVPVSVQFLDFQSKAWTPTAREGKLEVGCRVSCSRARPHPTSVSASETN